MKIIYSGLGERADDVIKRIISKERKEWIVVTSDRDIAGHAWAVNAIPVSSEAFYSIISHRTGADTFIEDAPEATGITEDDEGNSSRKGSSHQLSKKEKAVRRALGKL